MTILLSSVAHADPLVRPTRDAALRPDGTLRGHVEWATPPPGPTAPTSLRVRIFRNGQPVAETSTDRRGTFTLRHLAAGLHQIVVDTPAGTSLQSCRVWPASIAPPGGDQDMTILLGEAVARGQSPIPPTRLPKAAVLTLIAAGAIAAPAIYNNTKSRPAIPASP